MTRYDAIVVGAGPAGSALAAGLAGDGARVLLLEQAHHPRPKACAEYASPMIAEELARIGVPETGWSEDAVALTGMDIHAGGHVARVTYADRRGPRTAWGLDRRRFDSRLAGHAAACGAEMREGVRAVGLIDEGGRIRGARIRDTARGNERTIMADWVLGADGARSSVARLLGVERPVRFPRRLGLIAHYRGDATLTDHGEMHVGRGWYVGLAPTPGWELNVGMALPMAAGTPSAAGRFASAIDGLPAVAQRLAHSERISPIRGASPIGHRVSDVAGPGWMLIGDAAGFVDPFTGEGIHRALRSARAATNALRAGGDVAAAYRRERRRAFAAKSTLSWLVQAFLAVPPLLEHAVARLEARPQAALRLGSSLGDCRPATAALAPSALIELLRP
jgi:geranylgeranyl reductase family protein